MGPEGWLVTRDRAQAILDSAPYWALEIRPASVGGGWSVAARCTDGETRLVFSVRDVATLERARLLCSLPTRRVSSTPPRRWEG